MADETKQVIRELMAQVKSGASIEAPSIFLDCWNSAKAKAVKTPGMDVHQETMRLWNAMVQDATAPPATPFQRRVAKLRKQVHRKVEQP